MLLLQSLSAVLSASRLKWWMILCLLSASASGYAVHSVHMGIRDRQNTKALTMMIDMERKANERAQKVDAEHRKAMRRLADAERRLANTGLRDHNRSGTGRTVSTEGGGTGWRLSDEAAEFLRGEARRADELKAWADACWQWVNQQ